MTHRRQYMNPTVIVSPPVRRAVGPDVIDRCRKCGGPIFNQSANVKNMSGRHIDGSPRKKHARCPQVKR